LALAWSVGPLDLHAADTTAINGFHELDEPGRYMVRPGDPGYGT
jgi:hypothetical protein